LSNDRLREEILGFFADRFGVSRSIFDGLHLDEHGDDIWAASDGPHPNLSARRPAGLRILRRTPKGLKPTSSFLILLGSRVLRARVELQINDLESILLGRRLTTSLSDGHAALSYRGDIVGCGHVRNGEVQALIPTGRRRELLEALAEE